MWWGFSPTFDFLNELSSSEDNEVEEWNILLIGAGDARHILQTIACAYKHKLQRINFYVVEITLELIARQLLLLLVALEPPHVLGLQEKTRLFLDMYGNTYVRPNTNTFIQNKANQLILMVTNLDYMKRRLPLVDLGMLKYKDRDMLETIFKFWRNNKRGAFDVGRHWDNRLRLFLGVRYDAKAGVFDWDYHMCLCEVGGKLVSSQEYKNWRDSGVAFDWFETECSVANLTLASGIVKIGEKICHRGYLGDIVTGPFITYGIECPDKEMLKTNNGTYIKRSTDIAERNLMRIFYEILNREPYVHTEDDDSQNECVIIREIDPHKELSNDNDTKENVAQMANRSGNSEWKPKKIKEETYTAIPTDFAKVFFLPVAALTSLQGKEAYKDFFHGIFISQYMVNSLTPELINMARNKAKIFVESRKFLMTLRKEGLKEYADLISQKAKLSSCELCSEYNPSKDSFAKLRVTKDV